MRGTYRFEKGPWLFDKYANITRHNHTKLTGNIILDTTFRTKWSQSALDSEDERRQCQWSGLLSCMYSCMFYVSQTYCKIEHDA